MCKVHVLFWRCALTVASSEATMLSTTPATPRPSGMRTPVGYLLEGRP